MVINEYLDVARGFFTGAEPGMANAVLDRLARLLRPGEFARIGDHRMADPIIGTGAYRYRFQREWARLPRWWNFGEAHLPGPPRTSVKGAVAANGDVYVLCRAAHPVLVFDTEGRFITSWGEGQFSSFVHGMTIDRAGRVWITDTGLHTVTEHEPDGTLAAHPRHAQCRSPTLYGKPFNMPTGVAFSRPAISSCPTATATAVSTASRPTGELKHSWGEPGTGPGQFALVHFITADAGDQLYVCDRENHRIQLFTPSGECWRCGPASPCRVISRSAARRSMSPAPTAYRSGRMTAASSRSSDRTSRTTGRSTCTASGSMPTRTSTSRSSIGQ